MATLRQIEANRRNAEKSTGPGTEAGKAVSRFNALKSGIDAESDTIPCDEPADLKRLIAEYVDRFQPTTPEARFLVDTLIANDWLLRRLRIAEGALWDHEIYQTFKGHEHAVALALENQSDLFERLQRRMNAAQRNYHRALAELQRLQPSPPQPSVARPAIAPAATAPALTPAPTTTPTPIGFVPPHSLIPSSHGPDSIGASLGIGPRHW